MHELSLAMALIEQIESILPHHEVERLVGVTVEVGGLSGVDKEAFATCFEIAAQGSRAHGATLELIDRPAVARCRGCSERRPWELMEPAPCARCGGWEIEVVTGRELVLQSLEVD